MTRPYSGLSRRDRELDAQAMAERAEQVGELLDAAEAPPAQRSLRTMPLGLLLAGTRFRWANVEFSAQDRFHTSQGVEMRGVVYEQSLPARHAFDGTAKGTLGLMPMTELVEVIP